MKKLVLAALAVPALFLAPIANAQIISQTPRPSVPEADGASVEEIKPKGRIGSPGQIIKIARTGALLFAGFDRNDDYIIDAAEVSSGIDRAFYAADNDDDGSLTLVELEDWRLRALGSIDAAPNNFAFAPNFARSVSKEKFREVVTKLAETLDKDPDGNMDGKIAMADLQRNRRAPRAVSDDDGNCMARVREERRRVEQQCRAQRGY
jgi:hypothetical protein